MTDTTTQVESPDTPATPDEPQTLSLEDVYREAGVTEQTAQPPAAPAAEPSWTPPPPISNIPDAYEDGHKEFLQSLVSKTAALEATQQKFVQQEAQRAQQAAMAKLEEDIKDAASFVKENAGLDGLPLDDKAKMALAHFELNERASTDPKFKALWDKRNDSPQNKAALSKALKVISGEISKKFEVKTDPQLVANKRALKAAQQSSATTETPSSDEPSWGTAPATSQDFDRAWQNMVRGYN